MAISFSPSTVTEVISHATAPAFVLGAVAAFLSIMISRLERITERKRAVKESGSNELLMASQYDHRIHLLNQAILMCVLSALVTAALLILAFAFALLESSHEFGMAIMFILALGLLMTSLVQFAREVRIAIRTIHVD